MVKMVCSIVMLRQWCIVICAPLPLPPPIFIRQTHLAKFEGLCFSRNSILKRRVLCKKFLPLISIPTLKIADIA